jgi:hypothetical protein
MSFFKLSSAICVLAICTGIISARAQDNPAQAAARAALEQKFQSMTPAHPVGAMPGRSPVLADPQPAATVQTPAGLAPSAQAVAAEKTKAAMASNANPAINQPGLKPIVAPPLPISAAKQAQLDTLLDLYKADRISPADYQKQREAILTPP